MKCDDCQNLLAEYIDGEAIESNAEQVRAHLITCAECTHEFETLTAEQEIFVRYDRELNISPAMWHAIEARTTERRPSDSTSRMSLPAWLTGLFAAPRHGLAGALAVLIIGVVIGVVYLRTQPRTKTPEHVAGATSQPPTRMPDNLVAEVNPPAPPRTLK